jgi:ribosomal protein S18 acetylase RimI-like enzyme
VAGSEAAPVNEPFLRPAVETDLPFLKRMLARAAGWRSEEYDDSLLQDPLVARYVLGWGRSGDRGCIVSSASGLPVGAAWYRLFTADEPGFGFVGAGIPEVTLAVEVESRRSGRGTALLQGLIDQAVADDFEALSLSVETDNPARHLYQRLGFERFSEHESSLTLVRRL